MKVILKEDVKKLGKKDSMVEVSDGYARNFLFPKNLAVEASNSNINTMKQKNESAKIKKEKEIANAKELAAKLKDTTVVIKSKAGTSGKLFGAITNKEISDALKKDFGFDVDKKKIVLSDPIKAIGSFNVQVKVYPEISAELLVKVELID